MIQASEVQHMHHYAYFLPQDAFITKHSYDQLTIKSKNSIPWGHVDWFKTPSITLDVFKEVTWLTFPPLLKWIFLLSLTLSNTFSFMHYIPQSLWLIKPCSNIFEMYSFYLEIPRFEPIIVKYHIDTCPNTSPVW